MKDNNNKKSLLIFCIIMVIFTTLIIIIFYKKDNAINNNNNINTFNGNYQNINQNINQNQNVNNQTINVTEIKVEEIKSLKMLFSLDKIINEMYELPNDVVNKVFINNSSSINCSGECNFIPLKILTTSVNNLDYYFIDGITDILDFESNLLDSKSTKFLIVKDENTYGIVQLNTRFSLEDTIKEYKFSNISLVQNDYNKFTTNSIKDLSIANYYETYYKKLLKNHADLAYERLSQNSKNKIVKEEFISNIEYYQDMFYEGFFSYSLKNDNEKRLLTFEMWNDDMILFTIDSPLDFTVEFK